MRQRRRGRIRRIAFLGVAGVAGVAIIIGLFLPSFLTPSAGPQTPASSRGGPGEKPTVQQGIHVVPGQSYEPYSSIPPTSGAMYGAPLGPIAWGIYSEPVEDEAMVHNLEHGGVHLFYSTQDQDLIAKLEGLATKQAGFPCYLIVAPYPKMEQTIALTAWGAVQYFGSLEESRIQEFIDFYRNQGPERIPCSP